MTKKFMLGLINAGTMLELYLAMLLAFLTLYNTTMLNSAGNRKKVVEHELNRYAMRILISFIVITVIYLILSVFETINLALYLSGGGMITMKAFEVINILYLFPALLSTYILFASHKHFKMLVPQINLPNLLLVQGLAVFWMYLNVLRSEFTVLATHISIALSGVFVVSIFLALYLLYLQLNYLGLLKRGHLLENIDFYPFIFKLNLALTLFGFAMLSKVTQGCIIVICNIMLAGHAILMNHTLSELGRAIKRNIGMK